MTTISLKLVTRDSVAMTMITRSKSQLAGCQVCLETVSSLSPPSIAPKIQCVWGQGGVRSQGLAWQFFLFY